MKNLIILIAVFGIFLTGNTLGAIEEEKTQQEKATTRINPYAVMELQTRQPTHPRVKYTIYDYYNPRFGGGGSVGPIKDTIIIFIVFFSTVGGTATLITLLYRKSKKRDQAIINAPSSEPQKTPTTFDTVSPAPQEKPNPKKQC